MPQQFISNNGQKLVNNALQSTGLDKVGVTTAVDKVGKQLNKQFKKTFGSEDTKNKIALEEQTEKDNKKKRAEQAEYNKMSDEEKRAHDNQKAVDNRIKSEQDSETQKQLYDNSDWGKQQNAKKAQEGSRKGSTVQQIVDAFDDDNISHDKLIQLAKDLPDGLGEEVIEALGVGVWRGDEPKEEEFFRIIDSKFPRQGSRKGSVSGKGSRPENLGSIASKIALGRNRSIGQESREGGMLDTILEDRDNVAQSMYGKPYSELSEEEKNSATNKQIELKKQQG